MLVRSIKNEKLDFFFFFGKIVTSLAYIFTMEKALVKIIFGHKMFIIPPVFKVYRGYIVFISSPVQSTGRAIVVTLASAFALPFPSRHF